MKISKLLGTLMSACMVIIMISCADDKTYNLGGTVGGKVNFKAINLAVSDKTDAAESSSAYEYYYFKDRNQQFYLEVYQPYEYEGTSIERKEIRINIDKESEIWSGGYNEILITFEPSAPEETSAVFTMPDGSTYTATSENPTFIWTPDSTLYQDGHLLENNLIKAESRYHKDNNTIHGVGYIWINCNPELRYNKANHRWYESRWIDGDPLKVYSYVKFTAENLTVGTSDSCVSYNYIFPETVVERNETVTIPFIGYEGNHRINTRELTSNDFLMLGNTDVKFTFIPEEGQTSMTLSLPDGSNHILTKDNPSYIWTLTRNQVRDFYYRRSIYGYSTYLKDGIVFDCEGRIEMLSMTEIWYDPESGVFRSDYWN